MIKLMPFILVGIGGMIGSLMRYGITLLTKDISVTIPYGTLVSNIAGCFIIGAVTALADQRAIMSGEMRLFFATGLCGGFTTLSSMMYEIQKMIADREFAIASLYLASTFAVSFVALLCGMACVRLLVKG